MSLPNNRQELLEFFNDNLRSEAEHYAESERSRFDVGRVKTFLIEGNLDGEEEKIPEFLNAHSEIKGFEIENMDDSLFRIIDPRAEGVLPNKTFYLDVRDRRFWLLFTLAKIDVANNFIKTFLSSPKLDHAWFPSQFVKKLLSKGQFRGYGGIFDNKPLLKNYKIEEREDLLTQASMKFWGNQADESLEIIEKTKLKDRFAFYNARIKYFFGGENVTEDLYSNGKMVTVGQSFNAHLDLVNDIYLGTYKDLIVNKIEEEFSIAYKSTKDGVVISGDPIIIKYNREPTLNIQYFINSVFDGTFPFRLMGTILQKGNDYARIAALDLHVGEPIEFIVRPHQIEIYLPSKTCGNTIARFLTLFQRHFVSTANAINTNDEELF